MATTLPAPHPPDTRHEPRVRHRRALGGTLLLLGTILTATGAGLGIRHLQKVGLAPLSVLGIALLVAGLAALAWGVRLLWQALRGWRRLALLPLLVLVLVAVFSGTLAVMFTIVPPTPLDSRTPADRGMADYREVEVPTRDGVTLSGWYVPSRNSAAVVVLHGAGSNRTAVLPQAEVLARHGYGLLLLDERGHGDSGGRGMHLGWYGDLDVGAGVAFLAEQADVDPGRIGLVGLSLGGEQAVGAAPAVDRVRAVVAEGATARTAEDKEGWLPGGVPGLLQRGIDRVTFGLVDVLTPASPPRSLYDGVREAEQAEFLLVTAGEMPDEGRAAEHLASADPDRVEVWDVPGAGHTGGLDRDPAGWEQRVVGFLDRRLTEATP